MANKSGCRCPRCTIRGLMGPAVLITIGVLFLLHEVRGSIFDFSNTWPFILIVIGAILLASSVFPKPDPQRCPARRRTHCRDRDVNCSCPAFALAAAAFSADCF